jgi:hypothetical protein
LENLGRIAVIAVIARHRAGSENQDLPLINTDDTDQKIDLPRICADERGLNDLAAN